MIQAPLEACRARRWETAAVCFALMVVTAIPMTLGVSAICAREAATDWLEGYAPVVYLVPGTSAETANKLAAELAEWPSVAQAELREPKDAHAVLTARLGEELVTELGVTPAMLPRSIVLEPSVPLVGHIDMVARVAGLEARADVDAVDVPSPAAMDVIEAASAGLVLAALAAVLGLFAALVLLFGYLKRLRVADADVDRVVALFGAYRGDLARPTFVRGLSVAGACGVVVSAGGALMLLGWHLWSPGLLGVATAAPFAAWSTVASVAVLLPLVGFLAAWAAAREPVRIWGRAHA